MPIKNYTTKIDVFKTIGEIQGCLVRHGARQIMQQYDESGQPQAICFSIETQFGIRGVKLPANTDSVHLVLLNQKVKVDKEQAARVAWRIVKDWVDAQMAILESEMVKMDEIFLPYMIADKTGNTLYQLYNNNQLCLEKDNKV